MSKIIYEQNKRRVSCGVCARQAERPEGLNNHTCFSCGLSYTPEGKVDWSMEISRKKLYDEFDAEGIKLTEHEVKTIMAACFTMANSRKFRFRPTFQSMVAIAIEDIKKSKDKRGARLTLTRDTGLITHDGKKIEKEI